MALEDIQYLYKHSEKKSYMFYIDSKDRDKETFPNPNKYAITFSSPFKNVYSLEILDASIPRTQYAIDIHNNILVYKYNSSITTMHIPVGDYNSKNFIIAINNEFSDKNQSIFLDDLSTPADERSTFVFKSELLLILDMQKSTIASVLGFDLLAHKNEYDESNKKRFDVLETYNDLNKVYDESIIIPVKPDIIDYTNKEIYESKLEFYNKDLAKLRKYQHKIFCSTNNESDGSQYYHENNDFVGPLNVNMSFVLKDSTKENKFNAIAQTFTITPNSKISNIQLFFNDNKTIKYNLAFYEINEDGSFTANDYIFLDTTENPENLKYSFTKATDENFRSLTISDNRTSDINKLMLVLYHNDETLNNTSIGINSSISDENMYVLNYNGTIDNGTIDNGTIDNGTIDNGTIDNGKLYSVITDTDGTIKTSEIQNNNMIMCMNVVTKSLLHKIVAPGIYNLIGDRYAILRCPEIEQHLFASHSFEKYSMGLAKFKLAVLGYDESRFDFASLPPREFHPIGKLSQMTFSFERPDKSLYNFRGLNHTLTLAIRYLVPIQTEQFTKFILNPEYNPDFFQYQQNQESESEDSE